MNQQQNRQAEITTGSVVALFALVSTLHQKGVIQYSDYRAELTHRETSLAIPFPG